MTSSDGFSQYIFHSAIDDVGGLDWCMRAAVCRIRLNDAGSVAGVLFSHR